MESIRALHLARAGAVKARTARVNQLHAQIVTAPAELREQLIGRKGHRPADTCAHLRPSDDLPAPTQGVKAALRHLALRHLALRHLALRHLALRHRSLTTEIDELDAELKILVTQARPDPLAVHGVGVETTAQPLATRGDNPDRLHRRSSPRIAVRCLCGLCAVSVRSLSAAHLQRQDQTPPPQPRR